MSLPTGSVCKFCKHTYMHPCHGESEKCPNAMWLRAGKDVDKYKRMADKLFVPKPKPAETVERIVESKPAKKGRVRL